VPVALSVIVVAVTRYVGDTPGLKVPFIVNILFEPLTVIGTVKVVVELAFTVTFLKVVVDEPPIDCVTPEKFTLALPFVLVYVPLLTQLPVKDKVDLPWEIVPLLLIAMVPDTVRFLLIVIVLATVPPNVNDLQEELEFTVG
jgi:hypothetical protein